MIKRLSRSAFVPILALAGLCLVSGACTKCEPVAATEPAANTSVASTAQHGTVTVDAQISEGKIFRLFYNNLWKEPISNEVSPAKVARYTFEIAAKPTMLRFDFSESPNVVTTVQKVVIQMAGEPAKELKLEELPKWVQTNCVNSFDPKTGTATVRATGVGSFTMGALRPASLK